MPDTQTTPLADNEYRCAQCEGVYQFTTFDAKAELAEMFPGCKVEECVIVCDDCWNKLPVDKFSEHWNGMTPEEQEKFNRENLDA